MENETIFQNSLNPIQLSLLRFFNRQISENEILEVKRTIVKFYSKKLKNELRTVISEKNYSQKDFDNMLESN
jgi:hypothetical protein